MATTRQTQHSPDLLAPDLLAGSRPYRSGRPAEGLYDPRHEHDACGVTFVADLAGRRDHGIVAKALTAQCNLEHRVCCSGRGLNPPIRPISAAQMRRPGVNQRALARHSGGSSRGIDPR